MSNSSKLPNQISFFHRGAHIPRSVILYIYTGPFQLNTHLKTPFRTPALSIKTLIQVCTSQTGVGFIDRNIFGIHEVAQV